MKKKLSPNDQQIIIDKLKSRFEKNANQHSGIDWNKVEEKLKLNADKLWSLNEMENTGGEPDIVTYNKKTDTYIFYDCSPESPKERRSICYDQKALESRKEYKPKNSAMEMAKQMGVEILTEEQYKALQALGNFDTKTSSWIATPENIRKLGGALFCDRRYNHIFTYHNGAESYYAARGFRGSLEV